MHWNNRVSELFCRPIRPFQPRLRPPADPWISVGRSSSQTAGTPLDSAEVITQDAHSWDSDPFIMLPHEDLPLHRMFSLHNVYPETAR